MPEQVAPPEAMSQKFRVARFLLPFVLVAWGCLVVGVAMFLGRVEGQRRVPDGLHWQMGYRYKVSSSYRDRFDLANHIQICVGIGALALAVLGRVRKRHSLALLTLVVMTLMSTVSI